MANRHKQFRRASARANSSANRAANRAPDSSSEAPELDPATVAVHHVQVGFIVGPRGPGRADRPRREQAHRGRAKTDAAVPKLVAPSLATNRPSSEANSRRSVGNIASRPGGREQWSNYSTSRSWHREATDAAKTGSGARGDGATGHCAFDHGDGAPIADHSDGGPAVDYSQE
jgi:hypothetical protein